MVQWRRLADSWKPLTFILRRQRPQVRILSGAPSNFSELGLHRPIPVCANSPKTHQKLECWIGLPAREVPVAQMEPLLRNGRIERVWGRKNHSAGSPVTIAEIASHRRCRTIAASTSTGHDLSIRWIETVATTPYPATSTRDWQTSLWCGEFVASASRALPWA